MPAESNPEPQLLLSEQDLEHKLHRLALQILERHERRSPAFVGLHTRGVTVAERVREMLRAEQPGFDVPFGTLDVSFYRDDLDHRSTNPEVRASDLTFPVEGADVIIFDDVLYTGRTIRAAMESIISFGRPNSIELAVLVDRGNRELPIQPDYVGERIETARRDHIQVRFKEHDGEDSIKISRGD